MSNELLLSKLTELVEALENQSKAAEAKADQYTTEDYHKGWSQSESIWMKATANNLNQILVNYGGVKAC